MSVYDEVRIGLKDFLLENSKYNPKVMSSPKGSVFPKVVFIKVDDRTVGRTTFLLDSISNVAFEVDIYAKENVVSEVTIANELESLIKEYMGNICGFKRTLDKPTPNIDTSVYRITMRYEANVNETRNVFY